MGLLTSFSLPDGSPNDIHIVCGAIQCIHFVSWWQLRNSHPQPPRFQKPLNFWVSLAYKPASFTQVLTGKASFFYFFPFILWTTEHQVPVMCQAPFYGDRDTAAYPAFFSLDSHCWNISHSQISALTENTGKCLPWFQKDLVSQDDCAYLN